MRPTRAISAIVVALLSPTAAWATCFFPSGSPPDEVCAEVYPATNPVVVELGQAIPLPLSYKNHTTREMTFVTTLQGNAIFPGDNVIPFNEPIILGPGQEVSFPDFVLNTDGSMPIGTDDIVIGWGAVGGDYQVSAQQTFTIDLRIPLALQNVIQLPARWCVVEGSPQADGKLAGELVGGANLIKLLQRANDEIWTSQAQLLFRSAIAGGIPVICDPDPPPTGKGKLGDVQENGGGEIVSRSSSACAKAWERIAPNQAGRILVNARAFESFALAQGVTPGVLSMVTGSPDPQICTHPQSLGPVRVEALGETVLVDQAMFGNDSRYPAGANTASILAHEIGHQLFLGHGNGLDDNGDGTSPPASGPRRFDEYCEAQCFVPGVHCGNGAPEDALTPATSCDDRSLMHYTSGCTKVRPLQAEVARAAARVSPGAVVNGTVNSGDGRLPDYARDPCENQAARVLVESGGLTDAAAGGVIQVFQSLPGAPASSAPPEYLAFADLDGDDATGCAPSALGFPSAFEGAELVTSISPLFLSTTEIQTVPARAWRCTNGAFTPLTDPRISGTLTPIVARDTLAPSSQLLVVDVPADLLDTLGSDVRLQLLARGDEGLVERIPEADTGAIVSRAPPVLPQCALSRVLVNPGGSTIASATGLRPGAAVEVYLGGERVGTGTTDAAGSAQLEVFVPAVSAPGVRSVMLLNPGTAINAACPVLIGGAAVTPATTVSVAPPPNAAGWNNTDVTVSLAATDAPGGPGVQQISYSAIGAQPIVATDVPGASATIGITVEGTTALSFFATNLDGVSEHPRTLALHLDKTDPVIVYTGNAGVYTVDQTLAIACSASDALSGVVASTCADLEGPAYELGAGLVTVTSSATDLASNIGTGSTSFTVQVTYDSLCVLTERFSAKTDVASALCSMLEAAESAEARGRTKAKVGALASYRDSVAAQRTKAFSPEEADILTSLSQAL